VCQACRVIPKKTWGCSRSQRCFNKVLSKGFEYLCKCDFSFFKWSVILSRAVCGFLFPSWWISKNA
jgi:hypothetical protein